MLLAASPLGRQAACLLLSARSVCDASYSCGLLARLQSHFSASTSSSPPTAIGQAPGGSSLQQSASSHAEQQQACSTGDHQQQQHHTPHAWSSSRSWCFSATRGYADDASSSSSSYARMGRRRRLPSQHTSNSSTSSFPQQQQQQQQLGRVAALCQPTERLREAAMLDDPSYNPYADNRPELLNPRQVSRTVSGVVGCCESVMWVDGCVPHLPLATRHTPTLTLLSHTRLPTPSSHTLLPPRTHKSTITTGEWQSW